MKLFLIFIALLLVPICARAACINYLNVADVQARRQCGIDNAGDFSKCEQLKTPACNTNKCACYDGINFAAAKELPQDDGSTVVVEDVAKKATVEQEKAAQVKEEDYFVRAQKELLEAKVAELKAEEEKK